MLRPIRPFMFLLVMMTVLLLTAPCVFGAPVISSYPRGVAVPSSGGPRLVEFFVQATGDGELLYQWFKDGEPLFEGPVSGSRSSHLIVTDAGERVAGEYSVLITDGTGSVEASVSLSVCGSLLITGGGVVSEGEPTTAGFTMRFTGGGFMSGRDGMRVHAIVDGMAVDIGEGLLPGEPDPIVASRGGTVLTVVVPSLPPGCDCADQPGTAPIDFVLSTGCGSARLSEVAGQGEIRAAFEIFELNQYSGRPSYLQEAVDSVNPGTCVVLEPNNGVLIHQGPFQLDESHAALSIVTRTVGIDGGGSIPKYYAMILGNWDYQAPILANEPAMLIDGAKRICLKGMYFCLGNSGVRVQGGAQVAFSSCVFGDNFGDLENGGGATVWGSDDANASPVSFLDCKFRWNETLSDGGGLCVDGAAVFLYRCKSVSNTAAGRGGGMFFGVTPRSTLVYSSVCDLNAALDGGGLGWVRPGIGRKASVGLVYGSTFAGNKAARDGGGIFIGKRVASDFVRCVVGGALPKQPEGIYPTGNIAGEHGGGVRFGAFAGNTRLIGSEISLNVARVGGGLSAEAISAPTLSGSVVFFNKVEAESGSAYGAGIHLQNSRGLVSHNTVYKNIGGRLEAGTIEDVGGGISLELNIAEPWIWSNVFVGNAGSEFYSERTFDEDLFNRNPERLDFNMFFDGAGLPSDLVNVNGGRVGPGNVFADPMLDLAPAVGEYPTRRYWGDPNRLDEVFEAFRPSPGSPVFGAGEFGSDAGAVPYAEEVINTSRSVEGDFNSNFIPDYLEVAARIRSDCNSNGVDDALEIELGYADDADLNGIPDDCLNAPPRVCRADMSTTDSNPGDLGFGRFDGVVNGADLSFYVETWLGGAAVANLTTTGAIFGEPEYGVADGMVDFDDIMFYVGIWFAGCP